MAISHPLQAHVVFKKALVWSLVHLLIWQPAAFAATTITPSSSPNTSVSNPVAGVYEVSGGQISGTTVLHKFSQFDVASGDTVNLQFGAAQTLVNMIYDQQSQLNGVINGIQSGAIGGNVYFLNPHGVVVGASGVINAGALTIATPTAAVMDGIWSDASKLSAIDDYSAELAAGAIQIDGQINAAQGIHLLSKTIDINSGAGLYSGAVFDAQGDAQAQQYFTQIVNTNGAVAGNAMVLDSAGNIAIIARDSAAKTDFSKVVSSAEITVDNATLKGGNITLHAKSTSSTDYGDGSSATMTQGVDLVGGLLTGVDAVVGESEATAKVLVNNSTLVAKDDIVADAESYSQVSATGMALELTSQQQAVTTAIGYGNVKSTATATITGGTVSAGKDVRVEATNEADLSVSTYAVGQQSKSIDAVSVGEMTVNSTAELDATVNADNVTVNARNWLASSVTATASRAAPASDGSTAPVGLAVGIAVNESHADADLGGTITINSGGAGEVLVAAEDDVVQNRVTASTSSSKISGLLYSKLSGGSGSTGTQLSGVTGSNASTSGQVAQDKTNTSWTIGAATAVGIHNQSAKADIAANTQINNADETVVDARAEMRNRDLIATAAATASTKETNDAKKAKFGGSAAVVVGLYDQDALATVNSGAVLNTNKLAVHSNTIQAYDFTWDPWGAFTDALANGLGDNILGSSGSDPEDVNDIDPLKGTATTMARASASAGENAFGGTFAFLNLDTTSHATVAENVVVNAGNNAVTNQGGEWGIGLAAHGQLDARTISADDTVSVLARSLQEDVAIAGQFGYTLFGTTSGQGGKSVGAGYAQTNLVSDTRARVLQGADINAAGSDVKVDASSDKLAITVLPGAGNGSSFGFTGNAGLIYTNGDTEASVDDDASVDASTLDIMADDKKRLVGVAGTISKAEGTGVGIGIFLTAAGGDTRAAIAHNGSGSDNSGSGAITADGVDVQALSKAHIDNVAIAAAYASQGNGNNNGLSSKIINGTKNFLAKIPVVGKTVDTSQDQSQRKEFDSSNSIAGAAAVTLTDLDVTAEIVNATIAAADVQVEAINRVDAGTGAGGGALSWSSNKNQTKSTARAGAVAATLLDNTTTAGVVGSTITQNNVLNVDALTGGEVVTIGLGMAVENSSSNNQTSQGTGLSLSLTLVGEDLDVLPVADGDPANESLSSSDENEHGTYAVIRDSSVTGATDDSSSVTVLAYDNTAVQAGGGSLAVSKQNSVGITASAVITETETDAVIDNSSFTDLNSLDVLALNATRIQSGAAAIAAATGENSAGTGYGAVVVNRIANSTRVSVDGTTATDIGDHLVLLAQDSAGVNLLDNRLQDSSRSNGNVVSLLTGSTAAATGTLAQAIDAEADQDVGGGDGVEIEEDNSNNTTTNSRTYDDNNDWVDTRLSALLSQQSLGSQGNGSAIYSVAGGGAGSTNGKAAGVSFIYNQVANTTRVDVTDSALGDTGAETLIAARSRARIIGGAFGIAASKGDSAGLGSGAANLIGNTTTVNIDRNCVPDCSGKTMTLQGSDVQVQARDRSYIAGFSGQISGTGKGNALGAAVSYNEINNTTEALITSANVITPGDLNAEALNDGDIDALAAGVSGGTDWAAGISGTINMVGNTARAKMTDSDLTGGANLASVSAADDTDIRSLAATIAVSTQSTAGAVAASVNRAANTVEALIDGVWNSGTINAENILVDAVSRADQQSLAAGVGGGSNGAAGSSATNLTQHTVLAKVSNSSLDANGNIAVRADSSDRVQTASGSIGIGKDSFGVGVNIGVNMLGGTTKAEVVDSTVVAKGNQTGAVIAGLDNADTDLSASVDLSNYGQRNLVNERITSNVRGLSVNANSSQLVDSIAAAIGGGSDVGVGIVPIVTIMNGTTQARLSNTDVNRSATGLHADQMLNVSANHHAVGNSFTGQVSAGKSGGGGAALDTRFFNRTTNALVENGSYVEAGGGVSVTAQGREEASTVVVSGGASGGLTLVGSAGVNKFDGTTRAKVSDSEVHWQSEEGLNVDALQQIYSYLVGGSGGVGANGGAAAVFVQMAEHDTHAELINTTATGDTGAATIHAHNMIDFRADGGALQLSGNGGIAGIGSYYETEMVAEAEVTNSTVKGRSGSLTQVSVSAEEDVIAHQVTAMVAGGGSFGGGAAVSVGLINNQVSADINGGVVEADSLEVNAESRKTAQMTTAGAAVGANAGISGSLGVLIIGEADIDDGSSAEGESVDAGSGMSDTSNEIDTFLSEDLTAKNTQLTDAERAEFHAQQGSGQLAGISDSNQRSNHAIQAQVSGSAQIEAGNIDIEAREKLATQNIAGNFAGGAGGLGGAVAVSKVRSRVLAAFEPTGISQSSRAANISVKASSGQFDAGDDKKLNFAFIDDNLRSNDDRRAVDVLVLSGAAGAVALGLGVGYGHLNNEVEARLGGGSSVNPMLAEQLSVQASDNGEVNVDSYGGAIAGTGVGVMVSYGRKTSTTEAELVNTYAAVNGATLNAEDDEVAVLASTSGRVRTQATSASGGVVAANGAVSVAEDDSTTRAKLTGGSLSVRDYNDQTQASRDAAVRVDAERTPEVYAVANGVAVSGLGGVGVSVASAQVKGGVEAEVSNALITGTHNPDVSVLATQAQGSNPSAKAVSWSGTGSAFYSGNASVALAGNNSNVSAVIGNNARLLEVGDVTVNATKRAQQHAEGFGLSLAGLAAGGATVSKVDSDGLTRAAIEDGSRIRNAEAVMIDADSKADNYVEAEAGSGALLAAVSAAAADIDDYSDAQVYLGNGQSGLAHSMDTLSAEARHNSVMNNKLAGGAGGAIGGAGLGMYNDIDVTVTAEVGADARYHSQSFDVQAVADIDKADNSSPDLQLDGGGAVGGFGAVSKTDVKTTTVTKVGNNAEVLVSGDRDLPGLMRFKAYNDFDLHDTVKLSTGAAIQATNTESRIRVNDAVAKVQFGKGVRVDSVGDIELAAVTDGTIHTKTNTKTYGLASGVGGTTQSKLTVDNVIELAASDSNCAATNSCTDLRSDGHVYMTAGTTAGGIDGVFDIDATTDAFNKSAVPISVLSANGSVDLDNQISIAANNRVRSVKDVHLLTDVGKRTLNGYWIHKYYGSKSEGGNITETGVNGLAINGELEAGINHYQELHIRGDYVIPADVSGDPASLTLNDEIVTQTDGISYSFGTTNIAQDLADRLAQLDLLIGEYSGQSEAKQAYISERTEIVNQLKDLGFAEVDANGNVAIEDSKRVDTVVVDDVWAQPGDIYLIGDYAEGSGTLTAHGDATIKIINEGPRFLYLNDLIIPEEQGGNIIFNYANMADLNAINAANSSGHNASFTVNNNTNAPVPSIVVQNTYNSQVTGILSPQLYANGDIQNVNGAVAISSADGSIFVNGDIRAGTLDIDSGGDVLLGYVNGFRHLGGDPRKDSAIASYLKRLEALRACQYANATCDPYGANPFGVASADKAYADLSTSSSCDATCQANSLQNRINSLKSTITSRAASLGESPESGIIANGRVVIAGRYVNINTTVQSGVEKWQLDLGNSHKTAITNFQTKYNQGRSGGKYLRLVDSNAAAGVLGAVYNAATGRIEVDAGEVDGGFIEVSGRVFSTGGGQLKVVDGYSNVQVNNTTGKDLQLGLLSAGVGETYGQGIEGTIRIIDSNIAMAGGNPKVTEYRRVGSQWQQWEGYRYYDATLKEVIYNLARTGSGTGRSTSYSPKAGLEYSWVTGQRFNTIKQTYREDNSLFGVDAFYADDAWDSVTERAEDATALLEGEYLYAGSGGANYSYGFSKSDTSNFERTYYRTKKECGFLCIKKTYKTWATYEKGTKHYNSHAIRGDRSVNVSFIGSDSADVSVNTNSKAYLTGELRAENGSVSITANQIIQDASTAILRGETIALNAAAIGSESALVRTGLGSGSLSATAGAGGVYLNNIATSLRATPSGSLRLGAVNAGSSGNVVLQADGEIQGVGNGTHITGADVTLLSRAGGLGGGSNLNLDSNGKVKALANNTVRLHEVSGDMAVDQVSSNGDVYLSVANGDLTDANSNDITDQRSEADLLNLWAAMELTAADGAQASVDAATARYVSAMEDSYAEYQRLDSQVSNGSYQFTTQQRADLVAQGFDQATITGLEQQRSDRYSELSTQLAGELGNFDGAGNYTLAASDKAAMERGGIWTLEELELGYNRGVKGVTDTETVIEQANVSGADIYLSTHNGNIGSVQASNVVVDLDVFLSGDITSLTNAQKVALAAAEADDFIIDETARTVTVVRIEDIDVAASGGLTASAQSDLYVGSQEDLSIVNLAAANVRAKGSKNLLADNRDGTINASSSLLLEAATGAVGSAAQRLQIVPATGADLIARADQAVWLDVQGDLSLNNLFTRGIADLLVSGSVLDARGDSSADIGASWLSIVAGGRIGTGGDALEMDINDSGDVPVGYSAGTLLLSSTGDINMAVTEGSVRAATLNASHASATPNVNLAVSNGSLTVAGNSTAGGDMTLAASAALAINADITAGNNIGLDSGSLDVAAGQQLVAAQQMTIRTVGDAHITGLSAGADGDDVMTLDIGGNVIDNGNSHRDIVLTGVNAELTAWVLGALGAANDPLEVSVDRADLVTNGLFISNDRQLSIAAASGSGDMQVNNSGDVFASAISGNTVNWLVDGAFEALQVNTSGDAAFSAGSTLDGDQWRVGGDLAATAAGNVTLNDVEASGEALIESGDTMTLGRVISGGDQTLLMQNDVRFTDLQSGGDFLLHTQTGDIYGGDVTAANNARMIGHLVTLNGLTAGGQAWITTSNDFAISTMTVAGGITLDIGGTLNIGDLVAQGGDIKANSLYDMTIGSLQAAGDIVLEAGGLLSAGDLSAGQSLSAQSAGDMVVNRAKAGADSRFTAGTVNHSANVQLGSLVARSVDARAQGGQLTLADAQLENQALLAAEHTQAVIRHTGSAALLMGVQGSDGRAQAKTVVLDIESPQGVLFQQLFADDVVIDLDIDQLAVRQGRWTQLRANLPYTQLYMNNGNPALQPADVQLYQPNGDVSLEIDGDSLLTSAYPIRFDRLRNNVSGFAGIGEAVLFRNREEMYRSTEASRQWQDGGRWHSLLQRVAQHTQQQPLQLVPSQQVAGALVNLELSTTPAASGNNQQ